MNVLRTSFNLKPKAGMSPQPNFVGNFVGSFVDKAPDEVPDKVLSKDALQIRRIS